MAKRAKRKAKRKFTKADRERARRIALAPVPNYFGLALKLYYEAPNGKRYKHDFSGEDLPEITVRRAKGSNRGTLILNDVWFVEK